MLKKLIVDKQKNGGNFYNINSKKEIRKCVFNSFAIEDSIYRNYLVEQARKTHSPFDFIDMLVKKRCDEKEWKDRCRTKIKRCDGVIVLLSKNTYKAGGARWEIKCAIEEYRKIIGMHIKRNDKGAIPPELKGKKVIEWNWENLEKFINNI